MVHEMGRFTDGKHIVKASDPFSRRIKPFPWTVRPSFATTHIRAEFSSLMFPLKTDLVEHRDRHTNRYDTMGVPGCRSGRVSIMGGPRYGEA